ncbi:MAG: Fic family protein [Deltaproteobacteria bacterium]|jgi:Fic family protein|nr:Fic family protein [Deltaproteobacteria bacterium]
MTEQATYKPAFNITSQLLNLVAETAEDVGRYSSLSEEKLTPSVNRIRRLRAVRSSVAIEGNTLTMDQVLEVIRGEESAASPLEVEEVKNAFAAYEAMDSWDYSSQEDLLAAQRLMTSGLMEKPGRFRSSGAGVYNGDELVYTAPSAEKVPGLVAGLFNWLSATPDHPLVAASVFHYELEFIHPFEDGNGRMGRLWQTLILGAWKPLFACLPVEAVIFDNRSTYYRVLGESDRLGHSTPFLEFMIWAVGEALRNNQKIDPDDMVMEQVGRVLKVLSQADGPLTALEIMAGLHLTHLHGFRTNFLNPAMERGLIERTETKSPTNPNQKYRLKEK